MLLLDVYNALPWHPEEGEWVEIGGAGTEDGGNVAEPEAAAEEEAAPEEDDDAPTLLVRVQDEDERDWRVYEREPDVDAEGQCITCVYEFREALEADGHGEEFVETLKHHYLLPEQLVRLIDESGFAIEELFGDFDKGSFDPEESEHVVVVARRRNANEDK